MAAAAEHPDRLGYGDLEKMTKTAGQPLLYNAILISDKHPESHKAQLDWVNAANERGARADRFEKQDLAFKERIRQSYLRRQRDYPDRIHYVDASGSVDEIQAMLQRHIQTLLKSDTNTQ